MHHTIQENVGTAKVTIINKKRTDCKVRVMTIDGLAQAGKDYTKVDTILEFKFG